MSVTSIGDMAQSLILRTRGAALKSSMITLSNELSTGQTSDVAARLGGDYAYLTDIDRNLSRLGGYAVVANEASVFAGAAQLGLERMQEVAARLGTDFLTINPAYLEVVRLNIGQQARNGLDSIIGALNGSAGGRSLFAGTATDTSPLASSGTLVAALKGEVAGMTLTSQILQAVDDWFADPGGFKATMYAGSDQPLAPIQVGANEQVTMSLRADDPGFRSVLRNAAVAVLATDPDLGLDVDVQNALLKVAGEGLLNDDLGLTGLRADLGFAQSRIEVASSRTAAARTSLEFARNELLGADPYETASRLEEVQFQLESLYAVTVRTSRLTLLSFLK
jgi:flagellar hook-associated protein 3 FlgL